MLNDPNSNHQAEPPAVSVPATVGVYTKLLAFAVDQLQRHGLVFLLLALAVMWFYQQNTKLAVEIKACNDDMIRMYREDRDKMLGVIQNNTIALEQIRQSVKHAN